MATKKFDVVATIGKYTNSNGEEKKRYMNCGAIFESDKGYSLKLDAMPTTPEWNGWFSLFEPQNRQQQPAQQPPATTTTQESNSDGTDQIPF